MIYTTESNYLMHYGVKGMQWGIRNYQNADGTLTAEGRAHYGMNSTRVGGHNVLYNKTGGKANWGNPYAKSVVRLKGYTRAYNNMRNIARKDYNAEKREIFKANRRKDQRNERDAQYNQLKKSYKNTIKEQNKYMRETYGKGSILKAKAGRAVARTALLAASAIVVGSSIKGIKSYISRTDNALMKLKTAEKQLNTAKDNFYGKGTNAWGGQKGRSSVNAKTFAKAYENYNAQKAAYKKAARPRIF